MSLATAAYVGLGGNLGGAAAVRRRFEQACAAMAAWAWVDGLRLSPLYVSAPVGPVRRQAAFVNAVAELALSDAAPPPAALLAALLDLERQLGRDRQAEVVQGPRTLDLDLLLVGDLALREPGPPRLVLPHPHLHVRKFVLRPLGDLTGPLLRIPGCRLALGELLSSPAVASQRVEPIGLRY